MRKSDYAYHPTMSGDELRRIRTHLGFSAVQFAKMLGASERMYHYYEDGTSMIPKAMGMVAEGLVSSGGSDSVGTLTSYDSHRINVLNDAMLQYVRSSDFTNDAVTSRLLSQAVREIDLLLSKFES